MVPIEQEGRIRALLSVPTSFSLIMANDYYIIQRTTVSSETYSRMGLSGGGGGDDPRSG